MLVTCLLFFDTDIFRPLLYGIVMHVTMET